MTVDITGVDSPALLEPKKDSRNKRVTDGRKKPMRNAVASPLATKTEAATLSHSALKLQDVEQQLKSVPVIDQQRVDQLRSDIENGRYKIDAKRTADKFLKMETALHR